MPPIEDASMGDVPDAKTLLAERVGVLAGREAEAMTKELLAPGDLMVMVLRFHLFTESLLERLIAQRLPRPDRILERGRLSYNQKLLLVSAFDLVSDGVVHSLRHLNALRNKCAHRRGRTIGSEDIIQMGQPLGHEFPEALAKREDSGLQAFVDLVNIICRSLLTPLVVEQATIQLRAEGKIS
jgi:hypothetical protein